MHITQSYLTNSSCYKKNLARDDSRYRIFQDCGPRGLMLHSVGCPQPDPAVFVRTWNCDYSACVHAFVGADEVYQTLPWNFRGWHCGGDANNTHIGVEMTEPGCIQYITGSNFSCSDFPAAWAFAAKTWAVKGGIITGDEHGDLMLRSTLTREQFCVMLKRYHDSSR